MKRNQTGFTLIEIAIVLVIIGLLLGGVLKGQELINSAKVKNLANDFKNTPVLMYGYQDKFKAMPGDDMNAVSHVAGTNPTAPAGATLGNGTINGAWNINATGSTAETYLFWEHVRKAGLAAGGTGLPANAVGGLLGVTGESSYTVSGVSGTLIVCADNIPTKIALQLDTTIDDGNTRTGSMRATTAATGVSPAPDSMAIDATTADGLYTVCIGS